ncbi:MAG TPA: energy-coupling factor transporter transmembrane protein EcfT [Firmicutes bacterium]|nr:energy-coupling factor transporter transmembrane protein EcfT [Bacillota bacterium]
MKQVDPRVKLLWTLLCTTGALLFRHPGWLAGLYLFTLAGIVLFGADLRLFARRLKSFLPVLIAVGLLQILFVRSGLPLVILRGRTLLTLNGLQQAATTILRFLIIFSTAAVIATENNRRMIAALTKMGVPYLFSFLLLTALRFIPFFSAAFSNALTAVQLRGVQPEKLPFKKRVRLYTELVLPVIADAVVRAEHLAIAMEARGFGALPDRTSYVDVFMTERDWLLLTLLLGLGAAAFGLYYLA